MKFLKYFVIIISAICIFSITACDNKKENTPTETKTQKKQDNFDKFSGDINKKIKSTLNFVK